MGQFPTLWHTRRRGAGVVAGREAGTQTEHQQQYISIRPYSESILLLALFCLDDGVHFNLALAEVYDKVDIIVE